MGVFFAMESAWFSLENDGLFFSESQHLTEDPFVNAGISEPEKSVSLLDSHYSDISDDEDFDIPSSQVNYDDRSVKFYYGFQLMLDL